LRRAEPHLLLGFTQEEPELSRDDVERILNMAVAVPGHLLCRRELEFGDAEARSLGMVRPALDGIEMARVLDRFHGFLPVGWFLPHTRQQARLAAIGLHR